ncbi:MAG: helix-turn-helix transcriptional regulator [Clostridia bacterium]|nr:helix-turn-helix transcriptional regulator [Clostridia bacterium]
MKLKELRKEIGITQKELADKIGVMHYNVRDWESGKAEPSIEMLIKISRLFEVSVDYLIGNSDDQGIINVCADLSPEEADLLTNYRASSKEQRNALLTTARSFATK